MSLGVSGQLDDFALRRFAEDDLTNLLQRADGASVDVMGGKRERSTSGPPDRCKLGITGEQVIAALAKENAPFPGHLTNDAGDFAAHQRRV